MKIWRPKLYAWQDFLELGIALWLVASPFVLGFFFDTAASATAIMAGCLLMVFSQLGLAIHKPSDEWFSLALVILFAATPWLFGYSAILAATWNAVISSLVIACLSIIAMMEEYGEAKTDEADETEMKGVPH